MTTRQFPTVLVNVLLVAVHYAAHFDGGDLPAEEANPRALKAALKAKLVERFYNATDEFAGVTLTDTGRVLAIAILQEASVDAEDSEAIAEWAQSVSPRIKDFESRIDTWSKLELHALESMINEVAPMTRRSRKTLAPRS